MRKIARLSMVALTLAATATPAAAGVLLFDGGKVTGITGLDVGGAAYDVTFRSGTFTSVFGSALDFTTDATAATARNAVNGALNANGTPAPFLALTDPTDNVDALSNSYYVPFNSNVTIVRSVAAFYAGNLYGGVGGTVAFSPGTQTAVWADFTVVPLPGALLLFGSALAGLGLCARRRMAAT